MSASSNLVEGLRTAFLAHADAERAAGMRSYMRNQFNFLGISSPLRRSVQRSVLTGAIDVEGAFGIAEELWEFEEREYQYAACDVLVRAVSRKTNPIFEPLDLLERCRILIVSKSWWDTCDVLAPSVAGVIIKRSAMIDVHTIARDWIRQPNIWVQRAALLLQLKYKAHTDGTLLVELVRHVRHSKEFFICKGAGWALREYSKTAPLFVRSFLDSNAHDLSPLTVREASKYC